MFNLLSFQDVALFIEDFEACRLTKQQWTHEAHLIAGFWYAYKLPEKEALITIRNRILAHNESVGIVNSDNSGYHHTLTCLYIAAIAEHMKHHNNLPFEESLALLLKAPVSHKTWPLEYYTEEVLFSVKARQEWVKPDIKAIEILRS